MANQRAKNSDEFSINKEGATQPGKQSGADDRYTLFLCVAYSHFAAGASRQYRLQPLTFQMPLPLSPACGSEAICAASGIAADHFLLVFSRNRESWPCPSETAGDTHKKGTVPQEGDSARNGAQIS